MAIEFARVRYVSRSDGGNVCRSAAYNARSDVACSRTGERFFFAHRDPGLHHEVLLPAGADEKFRDPTTLWNAAQQMERRKDSQEARELLLALPSDPGLSLDDWKTMCRGFAGEHFVDKGVAVQIDIHAPHEGEVNVHAHLLITTRRIEGDRFSDRKARDLDPEVRTMQGGAQIVTEAERWGALWRDYQNLYFERQGLELRVDDTGFAPQRHEGPVRLRTVPAQARDRLDQAEAANCVAARDPEKVLQKLTDKQATFTELDIERLIRKYVRDAAERHEIRAAVLACPDVVALYGRETGAFAGRFTTQEVRAEEHEALDNAARIGKGRRAITDRYALATADELRLDAEQRVAFAKATGTDGLVVIEGLAGTGKSYSLNAIREAHERAGWRVIGAAPTNAVAGDLLRAGFREASSVHRQIWHQERGGTRAIPRWRRDTLVIVEEAAMLDSRIYARLMRQAAETGAKVILAGDDRQQASVQRGGLFTELKQQHGSVLISKVRRQEEAWQRAASEDFSAGRMAEGLRAYAERGHVHWSAELAESRDRLLSDWDQDSRERPDVNRFIYASTNAEVNRINRGIHDIRLSRGEIRNELEVDAVKGKIAIGAGERIQFYANDRHLGIVNGTYGTVTRIDGDRITVDSDIGPTIRFDSRIFNAFGLGYAGTVYRGQGKTQTEVYALYDHTYAWNARTAYVGMTRHTDRVDLYVSRDLAGDELALGKQMARKVRDGSSLEWATQAEVIELRRARDGRDGRESAGGAASGSPPHARASAARPSQERQSGVREEMHRLRRTDLTAYARNVHGFTVEAHPSGEQNRFLLVRARENRADERLEVRIADDGHWTWRDLAGRRGAGGALAAGDIFDLARREGAPNLRAAREAVAAYNETMRVAESRSRAAEERARIEIDAADPEHDLKQAGADEERRRELLGAEAEDRREAAGEAEERRQQFLREEDARVRRLDQEAAQARDAEQTRLQAIDRAFPRGQYTAPVETYVQEHAGLAADARLAQSAEHTPQRSEAVAPTPPPAPEHRDEPPQPSQQPASARGPQAGDAVGVPTPAQLRYTQALAAHYDPRTPVSSLAQASLAEAAAYQRDRHALDQRIAAEASPARRGALMLRRDIEHSDHMEQAYGRVAHLARASGADDRPDRERAEQHRQQGVEARRTWAERGQDDPDLYAPLTPERQRAPGQARKGPARTPEQAQQPRTLDQERAAMRQLELPEYAANKHGYAVDWRNDEHTRAVLTKADERLDATKARDGAWSYQSRTGNDRGDILDFEVHRGARTLANARQEVRPELERVEQERGRLDVQPERSGPERAGPSHDDDGPELDPTRRRGRRR
jgi:Ti-type conjugative transfer relaxase TraA